jgi:hypothetical protein
MKISVYDSQFCTVITIQQWFTHSLFVCETNYSFFLMEVTTSISVVCDLTPYSLIEVRRPSVSLRFFHGQTPKIILYA